MLEKRIQEKRDRDLESVRTLSERKDLHVYLEQKADLAVGQECAAHRRPSEAEADMETRKWEKRSSDMALYETNREIESQRLEVYQGSERMDQFMWRIGNETDSSMKVAREIAQKLKNCEEFVVKKQIGPDNEELMNCLCNKRGVRLR